MAVHGSSLQLSQSLGYLCVVASTQMMLTTHRLISYYVSGSGDMADAPIWQECGSRYMVTISSLVLLYSVIWIQRDHEREQFLRYLRENNGIAEGFLTIKSANSARSQRLGSNRTRSRPSRALGSIQETESQDVQSVG